MGQISITIPGKKHLRYSLQNRKKANELIALLDEILIETNPSDPELEADLEIAKQAWQHYKSTNESYDWNDVKELLGL